MNILILGANGFIGSNLTETVLQQTDWHIYAMDLADDKLTHYLQHPRLHFKKADITQDKTGVTEFIKECDVVVPLAAIANPALYIQDPLRVFALDFEANLPVIKECVQYKKRLVFPSTSEVYGMCTDETFNEDTSHLVTGPINKERWIYSTSKQLLDRVIYAYGKHEGLSYTLFRPFNWYGPRFDNIFNTKRGASRAMTQFIGNVLRGEAIHLVNGGSQQRCFTYVSDGIDALIRIIANKDGAATNRIFNVGNPYENISIRGLAELLIREVSENFPEYAEKARGVELVGIDAKDYFGEGYQDVTLRVPAIEQARTHLSWQPQVSLQQGVRKTLDFYLA
jgi:nucleoside-diphosphate-sugar epimerase